ncbi:MAG: hypothetical protein Q4G68_06720 [Planctomycetia bacterium]|nr:hypothetical protein [Planctomycetia bacterium]
MEFAKISQSRKIILAILVILGCAALIFCCLGTNVAKETEVTVQERIAQLPYVPVEAGESKLPDFSVYGGGWAIEKDVLVGGDGAGCLAVPDSVPVMKKGEFQTDLFIPERKSGFSGINFKVSDCKPGADNFNGYEVGFNPAVNVVMLGAHRYNFVMIQQIPCEIPVDEWFTVRVRFEETSFEVFLNDKSLYRHEEQAMGENDPLRSGGVALRTWQCGIKVRNLQFRDFSRGVNGPWQKVAVAGEEQESAAWPDSLSLDALPKLVVLLRSPLSSPNSVGTDLWQAQPAFPGCEIRIVDPAHPEQAEQTIFRDPDGCIYDMNLSYDAKTIFFSYRPKDTQFWNIYKIGIDGNGLTQLTRGNYYDVGACELPDGKIIFVSTRRFGHTVCQPGPASNLFVMDADGANLTCVSMNTLSDFSPQMLPDGRVLFTRWEYVDRDLTYRQSLWTQNPDGSQYQLYFGNTVRDVGSFLQARPLPDSGASRVIATFAPHHGYPHGALGIIDRRFGVEGVKGESWKYITKEFPVIGDTAFPWSYRDPYPLADDLFLCAFGSDGPSVFMAEEGATPGPKYRIWLLDIEGQRRMLYEDKVLSCFFPLPLEERERPLMPVSRVVNSELREVLRPGLTKEQVRAERDPSWQIPEYGDLLKGDPVGVVVLTDVYNGLESEKVERGAIKTIRIMEQIRKSEDLVARAYDQSPVMSCGTYYAKRCWGEVPVEQDGSAHFFVPALREVYFQALDAEGREVQRMTSAAQFMPGETTSCLGCHEPRDTLPGTATGTAARPTAAARKPDTPILPEWMQRLPNERTNKTLDAGIVDYVSVVQPVLDRYCVRCHEGSNPDGGYDLSGDKTRFFNMSYDNLVGRSRSYRQCNMQTGELLASQAALGKPLVQFHWLLFTPSAVNKAYASGSVASRLPDYFTREHCEVEVDAESMARVRMWIDADIPYYGTYANARPDTAGKRDRWTGARGGAPAAWLNDELLPIYEKKCIECHKSLFGGNRDLPEVYDGVNIDWTGRFAWINLTRPANSAMLTAHLSRDAGGRGLSVDPNDPKKILFRDTSDADYQALLKAICAGSELIQSCPEADMEGFQQARPEP